MLNFWNNCRFFFYLKVKWSWSAIRTQKNARRVMYFPLQIRSFKFLHGVRYRKRICRHCVQVSGFGRWEKVGGIDGCNQTGRPGRNTDPEFTYHCPNAAAIYMTLWSDSCSSPALTRPRVILYEWEQRCFENIQGKKIFFQVKNRTFHIHISFSYHKNKKNKLFWECNEWAYRPQTGQ